MSTAVIILAAGQGTRMQSDLPKVLHKLAGAPLLLHAMHTCEGIEAEETVVVIPPGQKAIQDAAMAFNEDAICVEQVEQLGTGHAAQQAQDALKDFSGNAIVLFADTPFIAPETLENMLALCDQGSDVVVLGFEAADPGKYGRLVLDGDALGAIVEAKDATPEQLEITLCNSGVICCDSKLLFDLISEVKSDNASSEFYLTSIIEIARERGLNCSVVTCPEAETLGINTRSNLADAEVLFQKRARVQALENGVTLSEPNSVYFAYDTVIGRDVTIAPNVVFGPEVTIESGAQIGAFCHLEGCHISREAQIGPFARLRPGAEIGEEAKIGNFVEIKKSEIAEGAKVSHLSYIGDAEIGKEANIGAGTITCNYDGVFKHKTKIGPKAFIGSNTALVAPVTIGAEALIGSGSVITQDVPAGDLALSRAKQEIKSGLGVKFMDRLRSLKKKRTN